MICVADHRQFSSVSVHHYYRLLRMGPFHKIRDDSTLAIESRLSASFTPRLGLITIYGFLSSVPVISSFPFPLFLFSRTSKA